MDQRQLGRNGLTVSPIGVGCMGLASESYGPADESEAIATLHRAFDLGLDFLDTSDVYGPYVSEQILGKALKGRRDGVIVGTKFGIVPADASAQILAGNEMAVNGRPDYVRAACEGSLQRLGVDHIDVYYQHRLDPQVPVEDTVGALAELVAAGKVRYIGLSEVRSTILERAHAVHPVSVIQAEYSLWSRDIENEDDVLLAARRLGVGVVAYSPLGRGFLSGKIRSIDDLAPGDYRRVNPRFQGDNFRRNLDLIDELTRMAAERRCSAAQLALAWVLSRGPDIVAIPGVETRDQLADNVGALDLELSDNDLGRIEEIFPREAVAGHRYPPAHVPYQG